MAPIRRIGPAALILVAQPAAAQPTAISASPSSVDVTIYRAPDRPAAARLNLDWLDGYALVTETRTIAIPAGEARIRFEGVAGGIVPESAIVSGLPEGVAEKNQDAYLLSPANLLDRSLGQRVTLRRTSRASGDAREEEAVVRTGADGAVVVQTEAGFEALRCSGLPETLTYDRLPAGLSARPTLSVTTISPVAATASVTLSYLATGFDWQANYIARLAPDGRSMALFAWVTLASGDETSFAKADAQVVAGRPNREEVRRERPYAPPLRLRCWPQGSTTSDLRSVGEGEDIVVTASRMSRGEGAYPPPPPPPPSPMLMSPAAITVVQEELGDLKLYRIPEPVTVAAKSSKQVALLSRGRVAVSLVYRRRIFSEAGDAAPVPATRVYVTRNGAAEGLGIPLPAGRVALSALAGGRPVLIGEGALDDRAVGEDVEIEAGFASGLLSQLTREADGRYRLTVTNDRASSAPFEAEFGRDVAGVGADAVVKLARRNGRPLWRVNVPANGRVTLRYRAIG